MLGLILGLVLVLGLRLGLGLGLVLVPPSQPASQPASQLRWEYPLCLERLLEELNMRMFLYFHEKARRRNFPIKESEK